MDGFYQGRRGSRVFDRRSSALAKFHLADGRRVACHAVNPDASDGEIAARWQKRRAADRGHPQIPADRLEANRTGSRSRSDTAGSRDLRTYC
jgi:hypothetical protein